MNIVHDNDSHIDSHYRQELVRFGAKLHDKDFVSGTDGNLSIRVDAFRVLSTPTSISKAMMQPEDMVVVDFEGRKLSGRREVSSEIGMHLTIYKLRPDVRAIVHAHPCTATGFASSGMELDERLCSEVPIALGKIPLAPYRTPGTPQLSEALMPFIPDHDAILMANHGVVTYGADLLSAYLNMEIVEHFARITLVTRQLGHRELLSGEHLKELKEARLRYKSPCSAKLA